MKDVKFFANYLEKRTQEDWDSLIIVESGATKGTGKTTFSIQLCKAICEKINYTYDIKKLMILDATEEKIRKLSIELIKGVPIHVDEAIFIAYKRDYNEDATKKFVKFINICRKYGHPIILNIPWFWDLDKDIRNLCDFRITVPKRGLALLRQKDINTDTEDLWLRKESDVKQLKEIGHDMTDMAGLIRGIQHCRNFLFEIIFSKVDQEEYEIYRKLSLSQEGKQLDTNDKRMFVLLKLMTWMLLHKGYTAESLANEINKAISESKYKFEYSNFKANRQVLRDYSSAWEESA
jgi:hypothetical protein